VTGSTIRGATLTGPDRIEIREYPRPSIPADGALLEVEAGGVCGTDVVLRFHDARASMIPA
jgi:D-arabinose 1-dehydrogenase-like Zn-dependent alcohol dehydrogenase